MATIKDVVRETGELLALHELWPELQPLWKVIRWQEGHGDSDDGAALSPANTPAIILYDNLTKSPSAGKAVLREFGNFLIRRGGERAEAIWDTKLIVPAPEDIQQFSAKLADQELRKTCHSYAEILQSYPQKGNSVPRLIAIHLANALIANNIPYADSVGVDVLSWGPTAEFASGKKYYALVPLTSAYCPKSVNENFGVAFAEWIVSDLDSVQDTSVAYGLKEIIRNVLKRAED